MRGTNTRTDITRRTVLMAAPSAIIATPALAASRTPIAALFAEWSALRATVSTSDEHLNALTERQTEIEAEVAGLPPQSVADLAMKVCLWYGITPDEETGGESVAMHDAVIAEMRLLAGITAGREG